MANWIKANRGDISFEDTSVGRLKKKIWDASDSEIEKSLTITESPLLPSSPSREPTSKRRCASTSSRTGRKTTSCSFPSAARSSMAFTP